MKGFDIVAAGEILIDMLNAGGDLAFSGTPGGAPCNVLAQSARLGCTTAFIGKVGEDYFGTYLRRYLAELGIDTSYLAKTADANTTLAFVTLDEKNNRDFAFYRKPGADMLLMPQDVPLDVIKRSHVFVYGGVALSKSPERETLLGVISSIRGGSVITAYDPNIRFNLWDSQEELKRYTLEAMAYADIVKLAYDELCFLTGQEDMQYGVQDLLDRFGMRMVLVTDGEFGCDVFYDGKSAHLPAYDVVPVDTTGAGDSFLGALLARLLLYENPLAVTFDALVCCAEYANAAGAVTVTRCGAIPSMPCGEEIEHCLKTYKPLIVSR